MKNLKIKTGIILLVIIFTNFACAKTKEPSEPQNTQTSAAPSGYQTNFTLKNIATDESFNISSLAGKIVIIDFWATWCPPCRMQIPVLISVYKNYQSKGVEIIGISLDRNDKKAVLDFIKQNNIPYTILEAQEDILKTFDIQGIPTAVILGKDGAVIKKHVGFIEEKALVEEIEKVL